jgi:hypothetical protein
VKKARLTKAGTHRLGVPNLEGAIVEYDELQPPFYTCARWVYYRGERIGGTVQVIGPDRALEPLEKETDNDGN